MGASIDIIGNEDKIETDLSMSYSSASRFYNYMKLHGINPINKIHYKNIPYPEYTEEYEEIYKREDLERLIKIAEREKEDEQTGVWNLKVALLKSKSKTFTITYWG
jgi:hypothetical protein